ncbi:MAG: hypothetical protein ACKERG_00600 [Candidatus Hodgkinia cicadicola]
MFKGKTGKRGGGKVGRREKGEKRGRHDLNPTTKRPHTWKLLSRRPTDRHP